MQEPLDHLAGILQTYIIKEFPYLVYGFVGQIVFRAPILKMLKIF